jgi:PRTRC genetic system protein C
MALQVKGLSRKFIFKSRAGDIELADPNPEMEVKDVVNHYSGMYPELVNCSIVGPQLKAGEQVFTFSSTVGVKG